MVRLGIPATSVVTIKPVTPSFGISSRLGGNPIVAVIRVSFRVTSVFPWLFMRLPRLRLPNTEYR